ncbi:nucleoside hydrolase [Candidatus Clostridium radicumherbarum]|uniref:Nucleoside hydrolase n=1 Tax=Candidatus Clostridium radicumherbarum TaxID=3381662 RepID=A0ABW8TUF1_9CLOT
MRKIIIDCDPGHDDAFAIMTASAHRDELNTLAVTTVGGNQILDKVTANAQKILSYIKEDIPLASGQATPLVRLIHTGADAHGETGMDGPKFEDYNYQIESNNAVKYMYDLISASKEKVTIVAIGPLTNIALLLRTFPEIKDKIEEICLMGGGINRGNRTPTAEFNIYVDPEAAKIVFNSGVEIVMAGLDVTEEAMIMDDEIESLEDKGKASRLAWELLQFYSIASKRFGFKGSALHDLCTIVYLLRPDFFKGVKYHVDVETSGELTRGMTIADKRPVPDKAPNTLVLTEVLRCQFVKFFIESLEILDERLKL